MRIVLNLGIKKMRFCFPTRRDQCKAGPGDVNRTATQHNKKRGLVRIKSGVPSPKSMLRFHAGSRYAASDEVVVIMVVTMVVPVDVVLYNYKGNAAFIEKVDLSKCWGSRIPDL
jgi:hypothetical protein